MGTNTRLVFGVIFFVSLSALTILTTILTIAFLLARDPGTAAIYAIMAAVTILLANKSINLTER